MTKQPEINEGQKETQSSDQTDWQEMQEVGTIAGIRFLFFVYRTLGRWAFSICLTPAILYYFLIMTVPRKASLEFLNKARKFGADLPKNQSLIYLSFKHFFIFGSSLLDKVAAWAGGINISHVDYQGRDVFIDHVHKSQGMLVIVSHLGNLEVCRVVAEGGRGVHLNVLVHTKHAERFNRIIQEVDPDSSLNLIQVTEMTPATALMLQEKLSRGEVLVIAGDRTPIKSERSSRVEFLGEEANFPQGPYLLASILKCPVYLMFCATKKRRHAIVFEHFTDKVSLPRKDRELHITRYAQQYAHRLQHYACLYPLQWFNFYPFWKK